MRIHIEVAGIALVKPEKAQAIENAIIKDAQLGKMMGKLTDAQVILKIEEFDAAAAKTTLKVILSFEYRAQISHKYKDPEDDVDLSGL